MEQMERRQHLEMEADKFKRPLPQWIESFVAEN